MIGCYTGGFYVGGFGGSVDVDAVVVGLIIVATIATGSSFLATTGKIGKIELIVLFPFESARYGLYLASILKVKLNLAAIIILHLSFK